MHEACVKVDRLYRRGNPALSRPFHTPQQLRNRLHPSAGRCVHHQNVPPSVCRTGPPDGISRSSDIISSAVAKASRNLSRLARTISSRLWGKQVLQVEDFRILIHFDGR